MSISRWEEATPYIANFRQWFRFAGVIAMRIQEASQRGSPDGAWFNWQIAVRRPLGSFSESLSIEEGGARSCAQAKRDCDRAAQSIALTCAVLLKALPMGTGK